MCGKFVMYSSFMPLFSDLDHISKQLGKFEFIWSAVQFLFNPSHTQPYHPCVSIFTSASAAFPTVIACTHLQVSIQSSPHVICILSTNRSAAMAFLVTGACTFTNRSSYSAFPAAVTCTLTTNRVSPCYSHLYPKY